VITESDPGAAKLDVKNYINDSYLRKLEAQGFTHELLGCQPLARAISKQ